MELDKIFEEVSEGRFALIRSESLEVQPRAYGTLLRGRYAIHHLKDMHGNKVFAIHKSAVRFLRRQGIDVVELDVAAIPSKDMY
ncbi:MAG: hypothetical protein ACREBW_08415, partial [Candidatus Micrarchaeaceae archaeon]